MPVYREGQIIGALAATEEADALKELLTNDVLFGGNGFIQLIDSQGNYVLSYEVDNIFSGDYFSREEKQNLKKILEEGESGFASVRYDGELYRIFIEPLGIQEWSLWGVEAVNAANKLTNQMILSPGWSFYWC